MLILACLENKLYPLNILYKNKNESNVMVMLEMVDAVSFEENAIPKEEKSSTIPIILLFRNTIKV
jgi:hypothetical protein